jgi:hypothetical protein
MAASTPLEVEVNEAMMPSPVCLISLPAQSVGALRVMRLWARTTCWATASPLDWVNAVEPTMSVNMTVTGPVVSSFCFGLFHSVRAPFRV